jgi:hypothetical protein
VIHESARHRFFQMLGIDPLPEGRPRLEPFGKYLERTLPPATSPKDENDRDDRVREEDWRARCRPWTMADAPFAAAWLKENERQIDLVVAATKRPRFYWPLVYVDDAPSFASFSGLSGSLYSGSFVSGCIVRDLGGALCTRAMFRIREGRSEGVWQDLLACHRLARLMAQAPTITDGLEAIGVEEIAARGDAVLAHDGKLTVEQARRFAAELGKLPPMTKMAERFNWAERLTRLDFVVAASRGGIENNDELRATVFGYYNFFRDGAKPTSFVQRVDISLTDWNSPMRIGNQWFDRIAAALSKPTRQERLAAIAGADRDFQPVLDDAYSNGSTVRKILSVVGLAGEVRRRTAAVVIGWVAIEHMADAEDRAAVYRDMAQLVFALAAYRAEHGEYPADLAALAPKYIPAVPEDIFSTGPLHYRREGEGYVLYSIGPNGVDDGGRNDPNSKVDGDWDDIAIRVPAKPK